MPSHLSVTDISQCGETSRLKGVNITYFTLNPEIEAGLNYQLVFDHFVLREAGSK